MQKIFVEVFKYADLAITHTNRDRAEAKIWSMIDDEDITVLVEVLVGGAKQSKILATSVRQVAKSYKRMRLGLILFPRFAETFNFYRKHGGFTLPFFGSLPPMPVEQPQ